MSDLTEAEAVAVIARATRDTIPVADGVFAIHVSNDETIETVDDERYLGNPRRPSGHQVIQTELSFAKYVELHADAATTHIWADRDELKFTAILNEHATGSAETPPGWRDWSASLRLERGESWKKWTAFHNSWKSQADFIDLLEDRIDDVLDPPATDLLEIAQKFSMNKKVTFRSALSLATGQVQLQYDEETAGSGGGNQNLAVPERITVALHPIKGDDPVAVQARLRWRVSDEGGLQIMVKLDRLDDVLELAWIAVVQRVIAHCEVPVLEGKP